MSKLNEIKYHLVKSDTIYKPGKWSSSGEKPWSACFRLGQKQSFRLLFGILVTQNPQGWVFLLMVGG
jgi:hypothetical protein